MTSPHAPGILAGRLRPDQITSGFVDLHPPLDRHAALVAADRCYFCYDAPCVTACPTSIDIPLFIRQIATGTSVSAGRTILEANILGGMCARVCPTEDLCEGACVRQAAEGEPVAIGQLQRFATDAVMARQGHPFVRGATTGRHVAVVGAGPAGLSCAHRLAMLGHVVTIYDARPKPGGLNEYGIAAYKATDDFAAKEVDWLLGIGGITLRTQMALGSDLVLDDLARDHDAVFLGVGLGGVNALGIDGNDRDSVADAVRFIADLRQSTDLTTLPVGRNVVVIGGGMTAVDAAIQSRLLGAEHVTIAYRRGRDAMGASRYEQDLAASHGVRLLFNVQPHKVHADGIDLEYTADDGTGLRGTGEIVHLAADQIFRAIGQTLTMDGGLAVEGRKIKVSGAGRTTRQGIWAGGDCALGGDDLTVTAVAQGRDAAMDIHSVLTGA